MRASDPNEPLDLTGDGFIVGGASTSRGGRMSPGGASARTVRVVETPATTATPRPTRADNAKAAPDRSRIPSIVDGTTWNCPFPAEADSDHIDAAISTIRASIDAGGNVKAVEIVTDPGHGFGREARECALHKRWAPALDRSGQALAGTVTIRVRFDR